MHLVIVHRKCQGIKLQLQLGAIVGNCVSKQPHNYMCMILNIAIGTLAQKNNSNRRRPQYDDSAASYCIVSATVNALSFFLSFFLPSSSAHDQEINFSFRPFDVAPCTETIIPRMTMGNAEQKQIMEYENEGSK
jgi:hypothetical protein